MAQYSFADYSAQEASRAASSNFEGGSRVSYFSLKNDNDYAVVRFIYQSPEQFDIISVHNMVIQGKNRRINCLREPKDSIKACPLCSAKNKPVTKFFVKLIEYVLDPNTGSIIAMPRIWERPAKFASDLAKKCQLYGNLSGHVFIVTRHGKAGDQGTTYSIDFAPGDIYKPELYPADFTAFETYKLNSFMVLDKTYNELLEMTDLVDTEPVQNKTEVYEQPEQNVVEQPKQTIVEQPKQQVQPQMPPQQSKAQTFTSTPSIGQKRYF